MPAHAPDLLPDFTDLTDLTDLTESTDCPDLPDSTGPASPGAGEHWAVEHRPDALGPARQAARASLDSWGVGPAAVEAVVLVVSELVTNAVRHALPPIALRLRHDRPRRRLWVEVTDGGPAAEGGGAVLPPDEHGRGLLLVASVALTHGARPQHGGSVVRWACLAAD
ncbi:ATP-binding protein [Kitasatospora purpeofusca]|uniref:ATP-binding protein n=1 Tax=Kitasatospora purpeofusca TaxID=67352 RepID=UPI0036A65485